LYHLDATSKSCQQILCQEGDTRCEMCWSPLSATLLESRRDALASWRALHRAPVIKACGLFGIMVFGDCRLLATS